MTMTKSPVSKKQNISSTAEEVMATEETVPKIKSY
jgi:hypothetical protein